MVTLLEYDESMYSQNRTVIAFTILLAPVSTFCLKIKSKIWQDIYVHVPPDKIWFINQMKHTHGIITCQGEWGERWKVIWLFVAMQSTVQGQILQLSSNHNFEWLRWSLSLLLNMSLWRPVQILLSHI